MSKVKFTKGELKRQRQLLEQYKRYLPILQLKKQQLQIEVQKQEELFKKKQDLLRQKKSFILRWIGLVKVEEVKLTPWIRPERVNFTYKNIAGVEFPVFLNLEFIPLEYDLFIQPVWFEKTVEILRDFVSLIEEIKVIRIALEILKEQLQITIQRVNLFEKVKIPQTEETIRRIKIYLGDLFISEVCRSKIAKKKLQSSFVGG
ncbi:MAG: V-type ATP synthase subunit D [Candidatus Omnitrophica bacterium]|nr:V-type ATP synthase subunit D [Candidatus Omnitrophota bacterium]